MKIKCPYCFEEFEDSEVHFRVPSVKDPDTSVLPSNFNSIEDVNKSMRLSDEEKKEIKTRYDEANFFGPQEDRIYDDFWRVFDEPTELTPNGEKYPPYRKRIIVPKRDGAYLREQNSDEKSPQKYFFYDEIVNNGRKERMVHGVQLKNNTFCSDRVCPKCHNPLPNLYGAYPVKFISIVGITRSGKTVYLSQFFSEFTDSLPKVGFTVPAYTASLSMFIEANRIEIGRQLPAGTPPTSFQQPIICEIDSGSQKYTLVIYDVAGELFSDRHRFTPAQVDEFAEFIQNSDAIMMLLDPMQFKDLWEVLQNEDKPLAPADVVLSQLHLVLGEKTKKIPFAACVSKSDEIYHVMPEALANTLQSTYQGVPSENNPRHMKAVYNAKDFNSYEEDLADYIHSHNQTLDQNLSNQFDNYAYFALSALGCTVQNASPVGPIVPHRIMDPFYWIMYKLGLIPAEGGVYNPNGAVCLQCRKQTTSKLDEPETVLVKTGLFRKTPKEFTHRCNDCKCLFNPDTNDYVFVDEDE